VTDDGVVVASTATAHWAWVGLRLLPNAYGEPDAESEIVTAERAWLAGQWTTDHGTRWEIRYTNNGPGRPVSCVLLGRVHGRDLGVVRAAAVALRGRLAITPRHVRAEPITNADEIRAALSPPRTDLVAVRKRLAWAWCGRRDTDREVCFAVSPLVAAGRPWQAVLDGLARLTARTTVAVYLEPYQPSPVLAGHLSRLAVEYATLAVEGRSSPMWTVRPPADPFAVTAAPGYQEATHRYTGHCYRLRVSVAADGPIEPGFAALLAGDAVACRPAPSDVDGMWRDLATLEREWLDETYRQGAPAGKLGDAERILCDLVDLTEAGTAFRFPVAGGAGGLEEGFPVPPTETERRTARRRIFVSYVREDLALVDRLVDGLRTAGYDVWIDRSQLLPGGRWKSVIKKAIADGDSFIACFSPNYWKLQTFMNEELIYAVERLRLMPRNRAWFVPAMLAECEIPDFPIGPNETLADTLQYADFGKDWDEALRQVIAVLGPPQV
jgi:TIR domain-containing protein